MRHEMPYSAAAKELLILPQITVIHVLHSSSVCAVLVLLQLICPAVATAVQLVSM